MHSHNERPFFVFVYLLYCSLAFAFFVPLPAQLSVRTAREAEQQNIAKKPPNPADRAIIQGSEVNLVALNATFYRPTIFSSR